MSRIRRAFGLLALAAGAALALPSTATAGCGLLGLSKCPPPPPAAMNPDGSYPISQNPYGLNPLPRPVPGEPLYPKTNDHLYFGMTDYGIDDATATPDEVAGIVEAVGGSYVRLNMYWPEVEHRPDTYDWARYDRQYVAFIKRGVRPLWTIFYTPSHAAPPGARCGGPGNRYCDGEPAHTQRAQDELVHFAHDLAKRYPLAAGLEWRNEPNLDKNKICSEDPSWYETPEEYTAALLTFARGVRSARPAMRVIGGALSNCELWDRRDWYLAEMLKEGAAEGMDALSWHPYDESWNHRWFEEDINGFSAVLRKHRAADMRLIAGEVGFKGTEQSQAERTRWQYDLLDTRASHLDLVENYDSFTGFVTIEMNAAGPKPYGWVKQKNWFGKFQAKAVFCNFRRMLGADRPMPSNVRGCFDWTSDSGTG